VRAVTRASCSENTHTTRAATLWWMIVLLFSPTISIPNSHRIESVRYGFFEVRVSGLGVRTTISSYLSSYGSLSRGLSRSLLMDVPLELFTSLMIYTHTMNNNTEV
jgi:hypothetical protein